MLRDRRRFAGLVGQRGDLDRDARPVVVASSFHLVEHRLVAGDPSFTPVGFALAVLGSFGKPRLDRLWVGWAVGCGLAIVGLAAKWHHAYYWMVVAPIAAVGVARGLATPGGSGTVGLGSPRRRLGSFFLALCAAQSASTWRTPPEWSNVTEAAPRSGRLVPADAPLIAPEAVLYLADRRGFRLEFDPSASRRAAGEWGERLGDLRRPPGPGRVLPDPGRIAVPAVGAPPRLFNTGAISPCSSRTSGRSRATPADGPGGRPSGPDRTIKMLVDRPDLLIAELP